MLKFHIRIVVLLAAVCCMFAGCATVDNNYLRPEDFADYLTRAGIKVDGVRPLLPDPFRATSGCGIMIAGSEIGVYKYDRTSRVQRKRLERQDLHSGNPVPDRGARLLHDHGVGEK